eukprot:TRINITY_DN10924_c0_g1_i4.p1 TRINITY_DN10924_c0_g1~~TRINITY_DN10924_c0_g1_i4.p1  ORF type:complete len:369 (-),score=69.84 TRINITY_DN10924_c0_g1_i4:195-1301(-)
MAEAARLRLAILGAARNVPFSVLKPVRTNSDLAAKVEVVGLASHDIAEAEVAAKEWGVTKVFASYDELLQDASIDAVYNVLPIGIRCQWTVRALLAGKHVLSETPMCSNARETLVAQRAAEDSGRVLLEGTHPTCHPVTRRVREMIVQGSIGNIEHIELNLPVAHGLLGKTVCSKTGAVMAVGVHGVSIVRLLAGEEPKVVQATARMLPENSKVDGDTTVLMKLANGASARITCSVSPSTGSAHSMYTITGSAGVINVEEWFSSGKSSNKIAVETFEASGLRTVETVANPTSRDTFYFQLMAFADEVFEQRRLKASGLPWEYSKSKGPSDAVRNMAVIDAIYRAAGMPPRGSAAAPPQPYDRIGMSSL